MLDGSEVLLAAVTVLSFAILLPYQVSDKGPFWGSGDAQELLVVIMTLFFACILLAFAYPLWSNLLFAVGVWGLAMGFIATLIDPDRAWWLWEWPPDRREKKAVRAQQEEFAHILVEAFREAVDHRRHKNPGFQAELTAEGEEE